MTLPDRGDLDWDTPVNNAIEAISGAAADALANSNNAVSTANYARQLAETVEDFTVSATDEQIAGRIEDAASATATALSASYERGISVTDPAFGATGDGVTDDSAAIQAAFDAATGGRTVFMPAGTYLINSEIVASSLGMSIRGEGEKTQILLGSADARLRIDNFRIRLRDFYVNGQDIATNGILFSNGSRASGFRVRVRDCTGSGWLNQPGFGAVNGSCNFIVLNHCDAVSNTGHGFEVADDPTATDGTNFTLTDCEASSNGGHGALLRDSLPQVARGMYIGNGGYGIKLGLVGDTLVTTGAHIDHPRLEGNTTGVFSEGSGTRSTVLLHESYLDSVTYERNSAGFNTAIGFSGTLGGFAFRFSDTSYVRFVNGVMQMAAATGQPAYRLGNAGVYLCAGATPESDITASQGAICLSRTSPYAVFYKFSGTGNTGWRRLGLDGPVKDNGGVNYTLTDADHFIAAFGATTITLPSATTAGAGREYYIKRTGTGTITIDSASGTIDGQTSITLNTANEVVGVRAISGNWYRIDGAAGGVRVLSTVTGINAKTTGATTLYTVPTSRTAVITGAIVRCTAASSITVAPTLGIGVAAGEDDIFASTALTGLTANTKEWHFSLTGLASKNAAASVISLGIDTAATGTSQTLAVDLLGYLI